jgi:hypothetical protein
MLDQPIQVRCPRLKNYLYRLGSHLPSIAIITAATLFLYRSLIDRYGFNTHEHIDIYIRAQQIASQFLAGQIPPQVLPDAIFGGGHAFPQFYAPLSYWVSAALMLLTGDCMLGVNLSALISVLLSGLTIYFMVIVLTRDKLIAVAAAFIYISVPYRFVNIFVRGSLAESWTLVWYPLIFAGIWTVVKRRILPWYLPVGIGGLLLSHNLMPLYFAPLCAILGILTLQWSGWRAASMLLLCAALGLGLSLWFILPSQYYLHNVWASKTDLMWATVDHVYEHRVLIEQFFFSDPKNWRGTSGAIGLDDDSMSFELGMGQLFILPLVFIFFGNFEKLRKLTNIPLLAVGTVTFLGWLLSIAFMLYPHVFLKILPEQFAYIQFPWRVLGITVFLAATSIAIFSHCLKSFRAVKFIIISAATLILLFVPGYQREKRVETEWTSNILTKEYIFNKSKLGYVVFAEYLPKIFDKEALEKSNIDASLVKNGMIGDPRVEGEASVISWSREGSTLTADLEVRTESRLVFPLVFYGFYRGEADGSKPLNLYPAGGQFGPFFTNGLVGVTVSPGTRTIRIYETHTTPLKIGILIFILSVLGIILTDIFSRRRAAGATHEQEIL